MQFLIIFMTLLSSAFAFRQQTIGVKGQLMCGEKPLAGARVKVWNKNKIGTDDQLIDVVTDARGYFQAVGSIGSLFKVDPHFKVYHHCGHEVDLFGMKVKKPCSRKVDLKIPSQFVTRTNTVKEYFDAGRMNMQFIYPNEDTKCIV